MKHLPRVLVVDPPWKFGDSLPGTGRGAAKHYRCMTVVDICDFHLPRMGKDAYLFLWRVSAMQREAIGVMRAWGFGAPVGEIVWRKLTTTGKVHFGMGRTVRGSHETCLIGKRGKPQPKSRSVRSVFDAPVGRHSEKPDAFYALIEELCYGPYVELFARRRRTGWDCRGDELEATI